MARAGSPIGIFDSGIGGLSVAQAIRQALPHERLLFFGDNIHIPYGERSPEELLDFSRAITKALLARECKLIVIACNTASAAALAPLRKEMPHVRFVGMEPAVKPAAESTRTGVVGVIATIATAQSAVFENIVERFAQGVRVVRQACPGLVRQIEAGELDTPKTEALLRGWLEPMVAEGIDALVLGCTHYPYVRPLIERICGTGVRVIDPAPAIARHVARWLREDGDAAPETEEGSLVCHTTGPVDRFIGLMDRIGIRADDVRPAAWNGLELNLA